MEKRLSRSPNPEMLLLARELRGFSQTDVARLSGLKQPRIARLEIGRGADVSEDELARIADALEMPVEFFFQTEQRLGFGTSQLFTRTRALTASERKRISGVVNVKRLQIKKMLDFVDISSARPLPRMPVKEYGNAATAAMSLRAAWNIPAGPVRNITKLIEGAGIVVVECDFQGAPMDATSVSVADMPKCIFISTAVPGDRWRFTLAHELAHLVIHEAPHPEMEDEADEFASEFLAPSEDIAPMLSSDCTRLSNLVALKEYWGVSIEALMRKALDLGKMSQNQRKWLYVQMQRQGIYRNEPAPIPRERPVIMDMILGYFRETLGFTHEEFAKAIIYRPERLKELYEYSPKPQRPALRIV